MTSPEHPSENRRTKNGTPRHVLYFCSIGTDMPPRCIEILQQRAGSKENVTILEHFEAPCHLQNRENQQKEKIRRKRQRLLANITTSQSALSQQQQKKEGNQALPTHLIVACTKREAAHVTKFASEDAFDQFLQQNGIACVSPHWITKAQGDVLGDPCPRDDVRFGYVPSIKRRASSSSDTATKVGSPAAASPANNSPRRRAKKSRLTIDNDSEDEDDDEDTTIPNNLKISEALITLGKLRQSCPILGWQDEWRAYSLILMAGRIKHLDFEITTDPDVQKRIRAVKGVGASMLDKINEVLHTGTIQLIQTFYTDPERVAFRNMMNIWGVGKSMAGKLTKQGFNTIEDVREGLKSGRLELERNQLIGVECYEDFLEEMARDEVETIGKIIRETMRQRFPESQRDMLEITIMGSYRRGKQSCGDVDVLITHRNYVETVPPRALGELVEELYDTGHLPYHLTFISGMENRTAEEDEDPVLTQGASQPHAFFKDKNDKETSSSYMGVFNSPKIPGRRRRVDIKFYPYRERVFASLYFTGNGFFNRSMRLWATQKHDYLLNDNGLFKRGTARTRVLEAETEKEVFEFLGIEYKEPNERLCFDDVMEKVDDGSAGGKNRKRRRTVLEVDKAAFYDDLDHAWIN